jgi:hypothetical protein
MDPIELAVARGVALRILQKWDVREREVTSSSDPTFMDADLFRAKMANWQQHFSDGELRGDICGYLNGIGAVEYKTIEPRGPGRGAFLSWRITPVGKGLLEGTRHDPGVRIV